MTRIDETTLQKIVQRWAGALTLYARQWTSHPEDAVQESLMELVQVQAEADPIFRQQLSMVTSA